MLPSSRYPRAITKTDYTIEHPGRVSILIPTCDHIRDLELCVDSIYARTTYRI